MGKKLLFLVNPQSGKSEIKTKLFTISDLFIKEGWEVSLHITQKGGEIPQIICARAQEHDMVVACGGDGTLNETVNGILSSGKDLPLGYIPTGTMNDFASSLKLSRNMTQAAKTAVRGEIFRCDIGRFNEQYFAYVAAFGMFTDVAYETAQQVKNTWGRMAYILEGMRRLNNIQSYSAKLIWDEGELEDDYLVGLVTNSAYVAGFPLKDKIDTTLNDGLLEVTLVKRPANIAELQQIINSLLGQLDNNYIRAFRTSTLSVISEKWMPWTLDGEYGGTTRNVRIETVKQAVGVMVDHKSLLDE